MSVVGVDGCRGGWLAVVYDTRERSLTDRLPDGPLTDAFGLRMEIVF